GQEHGGKSLERAGYRYGTEPARARGASVVTPSVGGTPLGSHRLTRDRPGGLFKGKFGLCAAGTFRLAATGSSAGVASWARSGPVSMQGRGGRGGGAGVGGG